MNGRWMYNAETALHRKTDRIVTTVTGLAHILLNVLDIEASVQFHTRNPFSFFQLPQLKEIGKSLLIPYQKCGYLHSVDRP